MDQTKSIDEAFFSPQWIAGALVALAAGCLFVLPAAAQTAHYAGVQTTLASGLGSPSGMAVDNSNNVYIADTKNARILVETPNTTGYTQTTIASSAVVSPVALAVDNSGNLYVVNGGSTNDLVKLVPGAGGAYTPLVISSNIGVPSGIAVTPDGTALYVVDHSDQRIYQYAFLSGSYIQQTTVTSGIINPLALATDSSDAWYLLEDGAIVKHAAGFSGAAFSGSTLVSIVGSPLSSSANALDLDAAGDIFVADTGDNRIVEEVYSSAGNSYSLQVIASNVTAPKGVGVDSNGIVLFANTGANTAVAQNPAPASFGTVNVGTSAAKSLIFNFTAATTLNATAPYQALLAGMGNLDYAVVNGSGTTCTAAASFQAGASCTVQVTFTPGHPGTRDGALVLNDNNGVQTGLAYLAGVGSGPQVTFAPVQAVVAGGLDYSQGVAVDGAGNVYIADSYSNRVIKKVYNNGTYTQAVVTIGSGLNGPYGVAVDGAGNVYIADSNNNRVLKEVYSNGTYTQSGTSIGNGLSYPYGVAVDGAGNVYIADTNNGRVLKEVYSNGTYTQSGVTIGSGLAYPYGVAVDAAGNVYVADSFFDRVLKEVYSNGTYTQSVVTMGGVSFPTGVAADGAGNVYIADSYNNRVIRMVYNNGTYTQSGATIGSGLNYPAGVAVDGAGNVYIADASNNRVLVENVQNPPALSFASTPVGTTSADSPQQIVLSNIGSQALTVSSVLVPLGFTADASACLSAPLAGGANCSIAYSYIPVSAGSTSGTSQIADNTLLVTGSLQTVQLTGAAATKGSQTITFTGSASGGNYLSGAVIPVNATSTSGLSVSYQFSTIGTVIFRYFGGSITVTGGSGTITVTAIQAGNSNYNPAPNATLTLNVLATPAPGSPVADTALGSSMTATVLVPVTAAGTLGGVQGLLQGVAGLDYSASNPDPTCAAGQTLIVGQVCSLTVTFAPTKAGLRYGAVQLLDGSGNILGTTYLQANGLGPQVAFAPVQAVAKSGLNQPYGVAVDGAGNIYVADTDNSRVVKEVYSNGTYTQAGNAIGSGLNFPTGVAVDGAGDVYIVDTDNNRVVKEVYSNGTYTQAGTTIGSGLNQPYGVAVDGAGNVYIADTGNNRVVKEVYSNGTYTQSSTTIGSGLNAPCGVAVDGAGNVYIADTKNSRVVKEVYSNGTYTQSGAAIGGGLYEPFGVALDGVGDLYIVDSGHSRVLKETYSNGTYSQSGTTIGSGLYLVYSVAVDGAGNVYIADTSNNRVLVERVDTPATVDFTEGGTATTATGVSSAPLATAITNLGNQPLLFPVPSSGLNPATGANFVLETNGDTTCPVVNAGGAAGQIAANATCTLSYVFAPAQVGSLTGASVLTDNNLNVGGSTQSITLTGKSTQGTQTAQTITFPQPTATSYPGSATLTATASSGLPVTYTVTSGPATVSGSTLTYTGMGTVVVTASQAGNVTYSAATPVSVSLGVGLAQSNVSWNPAKLSFYTGATLDNTILDATDSIPATISYSDYLLSAGSASAAPVSSGTVLKPAGVYGLQALITSNYSAYGTETITLPITVQNMNLFVANGVAGVGSLYNNSIQQTAATTAGGIGAAVDSTGNVWSANADGSGVSRFSNLGVPLANYNAAPAGISSPTAVAIDGAGAVWVSNSGNGTVSQYSNAGAVLSPSAGFSTGSTGASAIAVDQSGSVWVANASGNSVTRMLGAAAPTISLPSGVANQTLGTRP